jgi:hypothetical protein
MDRVKRYGRIGSMAKVVPELLQAYPEITVYVLAADYDRVLAERESLQQLLNQRDEELHSLEQRRRAEFDNGQAAERRVVELEGLLAAWYGENAMGRIQVDDAAYHVVTKTAEALNPTAEAASHDE